MKKLTYYIACYRRAKTQIGKAKVFNSAMLNLNYADQQAFIKWQVEFMNNQKTN